MMMHVVTFRTVSVNHKMKLSTWDKQVVNNFLNNNVNNINYQHENEDMFYNNSHQGMINVDKNLNFSSFGSFLAGKNSLTINS